MKNSGGKKRSQHSVLFDECDTLVTKIMSLLYGNTCQICGKKCNDCGTFHILGKGAYPQLRYAYQNILWAGWSCCHHPWHNDLNKAKKIIEPKIIRLLGENYKEDLMKLSGRLQDKMDLEIIKQRLEKRYKELYGEINGI